jgi:hypothetical protein
MPGRISSFTGFKAACESPVETTDANSSAPHALRHRAMCACAAIEHRYPKTKIQEPFARSFGKRLSRLTVRVAFVRWARCTYLHRTYRRPVNSAKFAMAAQTEAVSARENRGAAHRRVIWIPSTWRVRTNHPNACTIPFSTSPT